jgi:hypothetical protein
MSGPYCSSKRSIRYCPSSIRPVYGRNVPIPEPDIPSSWISGRRHAPSRTVAARSTSRTATAPAHLLMTGLLLDSKNTIVQRTPALSHTSSPTAAQLGSVVSSARELRLSTRPSRIIGHVQNCTDPVVVAWVISSAAGRREGQRWKAHQPALFAHKLCSSAPANPTRPVTGWIS